MAIHGHSISQGGVTSYSENSLLRFSNFEPQRQAFRDDVLHGLQDGRKELPSKYFYDDIGSQLFEQICEVDEYYLTRTELNIMQRACA